MKHIFIKILLFQAMILPGCVSGNYDVDLNPFYRSAIHRHHGVSEREAILPLVFSRESGPMAEWGVRPFFCFSHDESLQKTEGHFLPPIGLYIHDENRKKLRIWPLYRYTKKYGLNQEEDVDWVLFPILFGGRSTKGENYFAFFPFGGRIRNFLAFDTFDFFMWPLWQRTVKRVTEESVSNSILLMIAWTRGGKRDGSFQVLPFYLQRLWEGKYKKYSVLWPFFHYQKNMLDTSHPSTLYGLWPLFVYESSAIQYRFGLIGPFIFLGPLIQLCRETPGLWEGEPNLEGHSYYLYDLPWPLVRIEKNRKFERVRILPFYSHFVEPGFDSKAFLIPFFWLRKETNKTYDKKDFFFVPFVHYSTKEYKGDLGEDTYFQLWPLFHHTAKADGTRDFHTLSLIPLRVEKYVAPLDKLFWPFWNLYRYRRTPSGASYHHALFGLIHAYSDPIETRFSFPLLYSYKETWDEGWMHELLLGLISIGGDSQGLKKLRFLFIPFLDS